MPEFDIDRINVELEAKNPFQRVQWGFETFQDRFCLTSSFGIQAAVMIHIVSHVNRSIPILFLETGYHFAETLAYYEYLQKLYNVNIVPVKPKLLRMEFEKLYGYAYEFDKDFLYCFRMLFCSCILRLCRQILLKLETKTGECCRQ